MRKIMVHSTMRSTVMVFTFVLVLVPTCAWAADAVTETNLLTNGSFEFWSHCAVEGLADILKDGPEFADKDPLIPTRWIWRMNKAVRLVRSGDAHSGQYAVSLISQANGGGYLALGKLEVVPGAKYSFGVWAKGAGDISVEVVGEAAEGLQQLGQAKGQVGKEWAKVGGAMEIPGHIRLVWPAPLGGGQGELAAG